MLNETIKKLKNNSLNLLAVSHIASLTGLVNNTKMILKMCK
jgi:selenocysteine lyase/cysteine desulfurase